MSVNKVILVGRLGQNPEVKSTQGGTPVAQFSIATNESWIDKSGQKQEKTEWHRVVAWGKLADLCGRYLTRGKQVFLEGKIQTRQWQDKDGQNRYTTEVVASNIQFLGGASASQGADGGAAYGNNNNYPSSGATSSNYDAANSGGNLGDSQQAAASSGGFDEPSFTEDDIPF